MLDSLNGASGLLEGTETTDPPKHDYALAKRAGMGDESAFTTLYTRYRSRTLNVVSRIVEPADSEDVNQEVWIQVFRKIGSFKGDSAFTTWLHRLSVNTALMHLRKRTVKLEHVTDDEEFPVVVVPGTERPSRMRIVDKIAIDEAWEYLPAGYKQVLYYHDVLGYEHEEVAVIMGCSVGTSKSQLHKARLKMGRILRRKKLNAHDSNNVIEARWNARLGIELPAISIGEWRRGIEDAAEEEAETVEDDFDIGEEWSL